MQKTLSVVNLKHILHNVRAVKRLAGGKSLYAVVKADAYGHGGAEVASYIEDEVEGFCVAIVDEGVQLRLGGVTKPVLVFAPPLDREDARRLAFYNLTATVGDMHSAKLVKGCDCHVAINTGMNRYGCHGRQLEEVLSHLPADSVKGVYSHLYAPDNRQISLVQLAAFRRAVRAVKGVNGGATAHLAASGGILSGGKFLLDGVRCGLMLYGYVPRGLEKRAESLGLKLRPALKVYARLAQTTSVTGGGVGYGIADRSYQTLYTYRLGYADGFSRTVPLGEKQLCMDAFISADGGDLEGDLEGGLKEVFSDARAYASRCNTVEYEVLCSVTKRSERVYIT